MPWCHECEKEFEEGTELCPDCGAELFEDMPPQLMEPAKLEWNFRSPFSKKNKEASPQWPTDESGKREEPVLLAEVSGTDLNYEIKTGMLEAYGFPLIRSRTSLGRLEKLFFGFSKTGRFIYVPKSKYEEAKALWDSIENGEESAEE